MALTYLDEAQGSMDPDVIDTAVELCQRVADSATADDPDRPVHLHNLSLALRLRFERAGAFPDLETAIATSRRALGAAAGGDPNMSAYRHNLGMALWLRYGRTGRSEDLSEAIGVARRGAGGAEPGRTLCLAVLGIALYSRFRESGSKPDLDEAITLIRMAASQPDQTQMLGVLTAALIARFEWTGDLADLDEAIAASLTVADSVPAGHPVWLNALNNLCSSLRLRFTRTGRQTDIDRAISYGTQALEAFPPELTGFASVVSNIAIALRVRYERTNSMQDLDQALAFARAAVDAAHEGDIERVRYLHNLSNVLTNRYERLGEPADLDESIAASQAAVGMAATDLPDRPALATQLGSSLRHRFEATGALSDLDDAVAIGWEAVATTRQEDPQRATRLANLVGSLLRRFDRTGTKADIDQAITLAREARASASFDRYKLSNVVGHVLLQRYGRTKAAADLHEAIIALRSAIREAPEGYSRMAQYLIHLAHAVRDRFTHQHDPADLAEAISIGYQAVRAAPEASTLHATTLANLTILLGQKGDWAEAVPLIRAAVQATPVDHPDHATRMGLLGEVLLRLGNTDEAFAAFTKAAAAPLASPNIVMRTSWSAGALISASSPARAAKLLETALQVRAESMTRRMVRDDLQHAAGEHGGLASEAAAMALAAGSASRALRLLELGRGVMLSQALDTRSELTDLRAQHPELADRFVEVRDHLSQPNDPLGSSVDRHTLARTFDALLAEIRALPDFANFLLPPDIDLSLAAEGPIVVVNSSRFRSDAILLTTSGISTVPLPGLIDLPMQLDAFHRALSSSDQDGVHAVLEWLWDVVAAPILDGLGFHSTPGSTWPRLWWVPSGLIGFLPLHAAGYHRRHGMSVLDRVISSYTPTLRALAYARQRATPAAVERALVVSMPTTPLASPLPHVVSEATEVRRHVPGSTLLTNAPGTAFTHLPTRSNVLFYLSSCPIAHFACHGSGHTDPSQVQLLLQDHQTEPLTVASLAGVQLPNARLAYLSACETALTPSFELVDEAIHLTTAFQLAGYPHVIGTLWAINDAVASYIAADFYATLADTTDSARAIHHAIRAIRDDIPTMPTLWAAHLHTGA